ncbi:hypothetical protein EVAR_61099_1 [Eumeta japonica]|uniref:Uncharacterized protein n=1 Tax=Eumeta variegata TaxID=151549 RepID=A0A4C1YRP7_EUMVA|nr:hypothetical protein EVAR_61099_1 [Eumeta japonica]
MSVDISLYLKLSYPYGKSRDRIDLTLLNLTPAQETFRATAKENNVPSSLFGGILSAHRASGSWCRHIENHSVLRSSGEQGIPSAPFDSWRSSTGHFMHNFLAHTVRLRNELPSATSAASVAKRFSRKKRIPFQKSGTR